MYYPNNESSQLIDNSKSDNNIFFPRNMNKSIRNILYYFQYIRPVNIDKILFNKNYNEFMDFNINNLPLINVTEYLNIKVEKSNILEEYGKYIHKEKRIILGTNCASTFIHELVHAIDHLLILNISNKELIEFVLYYKNYLEPELLYETFNELVAELSTVVICKYYNIPINLSHSKEYLINYNYLELNLYKVIKRMLLIFEYLDNCIKYINKITTV